jgi:hypothetical protein
VHILEVCVEEKLCDIATRHLVYNSNAGSYHWAYLGRVLDMDKNLEENGVLDCDPTLSELGVDDEGLYHPTLHLVFYLQ